MRGDRSRIRSIRGPVVLITVGALFALQNFTSYNFGQTWPVILLVLGLLILLERTVAPPPPVPPPPQYVWQPPADQPAPGGYRATSYAQGPIPQPPAGADPASSSSAATGGFGTSAPPKPDAPPESSTTGGAV
jgi:hypothetical protein